MQPGNSVWLHSPASGGPLGADLGRDGGQVRCGDGGPGGPLGRLELEPQTIRRGACLLALGGRLGLLAHGVLLSVP